MSWHRLRTLVQKSLYRRAQRDQELDDEIRFHLAEDARRHVEDGVTFDAAEREARRAFGSIALAKENCRAVWVPTALEQLVQDFRFGLRILTKSPALSATAVTLLALVVGGNTTIFSMVHGILTKPAPGVRAPGLVSVSWIDNRGFIEPGTSYASYVDFANQATTLRSLTAFDFDRFILSHDNVSHAAWGSLITPNHFATLGVAILKGRSFSDEENQLSASGLVAVISYRAWQEYFQGAEDILGLPVVLNGHPATIIGVAAPPFQGAILGAPPADVWIPLVSYSRVRGNARALEDRSGVAVSMIGQLAPGASLSQARAELTGIWKRLQGAYPTVGQDLAMTVVPYSGLAGGNSLAATRGDVFLAIFSVITFLTLVIVCANVTNLLVARAVIRQREMALRQSLGASRVRIVRMLLAEGLVISVAACAAAFLFAWWVSKAAAGLIAPLQRMLDFTPDWTVAGYAIVLVALAMVTFTVAPAIRAWRLELLPWLKVGEQGVVRGRSRLSTALVVVQLAFSVLLLTSAGLAVRSLVLMGRVDSGFNTRNLLLVTVNTAGSAVSPETNAVLLDRLRERLGGVAGVEHATYARQAPRSPSWETVSVRTLESSKQLVRAERNYVGPNYLQVLGLAPLVGREFALENNVRTNRSAVVSHNLAETLWPGQSPIGRKLLMERGQEFDRARVTSEEAEVVGVAPDVFFSGFRREERRFVFLSAQQDPAPPGETTLYVRYTGRLETIAPAIRGSLQQTDAGTPIVSMRSWDTELDDMMWPVRAVTTLLMLFAGGSLLIAAIGQYAVVSFDMRRRFREIGLRMALGASSYQVLTSVLREGFRLTAIGLAIGFALSLATGRALGGVLYGITPTDSFTYVGVFVLLSSASLLACYLPARRASRTNPLHALRQE